MKPLYFPQVFLTFLLTTSLLPMAKNTALPLAMKLIYHNSINSPFFEPNITLQSHHKNEWEIFLAYLSKLRLLYSGNFADDKLYAYVSANARIPLFLVEFSIGGLDLIQGAALDTGSSHFWLHCVPCTGCRSLNYELFDPKSSKPMVIYGAITIYVVIDVERWENVYIFQKYAGGSYSEGRYATEDFIFSGKSGPIRLVFGCSEKSEDTAEGYSGVLGLGMADISLLSQLKAGHFSYCLGNLSNPTYNYNMLLIDEELILNDGRTTPFETDGSHYIANIEGISLGGKPLDIDREALKRTPDSRGGAIIDSGAALSLLQDIAYEKFEEAVKDIIGNSLDRYYHVRRLCYWGNLQRDFTFFPTVRFHFAEGATMTFDKENIFTQYDQDSVCLNIINANHYRFDFSLIGVNLQQYFYVEIDIKKQRLGFRRMDCKDLLKL